MTPTAHIDTYARDRLPPKSLWPDLNFDLPQLQYPPRLNAAAELLDRQVECGHADRPAIWQMVDGKPAYATYAQLQYRVNQIARVLVEDLGLVTGNRVLLRGPNNAMMAACWLAVVKAGLIAVGTMPLLRAKELKQICDKARPRIALCDVELWQEMAIITNPNGEHFCDSLDRICYFNDGEMGSLEEMLSHKPGNFPAVDTATDDVALIAFTSGTTGEPKGTMHFHRDIMAMCDCFPQSILKVRPNDIFCGTPPLAFTFGLGGMLAFPLRYGASTVLTEKATPDSLLKTIADFRATVCFTAPTFYRQMAGLAANHDIASLKKCVSAGEALPDATRQLFKEATGIELIDGIGATEMIHIFISHTPESVRRGATGQAIPGYRARVVDDAGKPCPPGVVGKLAVKGPTGCRYMDDPRQRDYVRRGWNITGDAYIDGCRRLLLLPVTHRRHDRHGGLQRRRAGGGILPAGASGRGRMRRCRRARRGTRPGGQGLCGAQARPHRRRRHAQGAAGLREAVHRALQISAQDRVHRGAAAHRDRQAAALQAAPGGRGRQALSCSGLADAGGGAICAPRWH